MRSGLQHKCVYILIIKSIVATSHPSHLPSLTFTWFHVPKEDAPEVVPAEELDPEARSFLSRSAHLIVPTRRTENRPPKLCYLENLRSSEEPCFCPLMLYHLPTQILYRRENTGARRTTDQSCSLPWQMCGSVRSSSILRFFSLESSLMPIPWK